MGDLTGEFLRHYKELDELCRKKYGISYLEDGAWDNRSGVITYANSLPANLKKRLLKIHHVRNDLVHDTNFEVQIQVGMLKELDEFLALIKGEEAIKNGGETSGGNNKEQTTKNVEATVSAINATEKGLVDFEKNVDKTEKPREESDEAIAENEDLLEEDEEDVEGISIDDYIGIHVSKLELMASAANCYIYMGGSLYKCIEQLKQSKNIDIAKKYYKAAEKHIKDEQDRNAQRNKAVSEALSAINDSYKDVIIKCNRFFVKIKANKIVSRYTKRIYRCRDLELIKSLAEVAKTELSKLCKS